MALADDLAALDAAIASGHKSVQIADKRVEYREMKDLLAARDRLAASLAKQTAAGAPASRHSIGV